jgi:pimeloyl-ACP methyl ester carboxylesterase
MPIGFWLLRTAIRALGLVSPALAGSWVYRLWIQTLRFPEPQQEQEWRRTTGVASAIHAVQQGLKVNCFVALCPPRSMRWIAQSYFTAMGISTPVQAVFNRKFEAHFGADLWQRFSPEILARQLAVPGLVIHDENDRDVPWQEGAALANAWPGRTICPHACTRPPSHPARPGRHRA